MAGGHVEVGTAGTATANQVAVDAAHTLSLSGAAGATIAGTVANAGTVLVTSSNAVFTGPITGAGKLQVNLGASLALNGAGNAPATMVDSGSINLATSVGLTVSGTATIGGTLHVNGGTIQAGSLSIANTGTLLGAGKVASAVANAGRIEANGGTLTMAGTTTGAGTLQADSGTTLVLNGTSNNVASFLDNGTVTLGTNDGLTASGIGSVVGTLHINGGTVQAGTLSVAGSGVLVGFGTVASAIADAAQIEANGGTLFVTGNVTAGGTLKADSSSTLVLNGTSSIAASVLDSGTLTLGASAGLHVIASVNPASTGLFVLTNASMLEVAADTGTGNKIGFLGASGDALVVDAVAQFGTNVGSVWYTGPKLENSRNARYRRPEEPPLQHRHEHRHHRQLHCRHRAPATAQRPDQSDAIVRQRNAWDGHLPPRRRQRHGDRTDTKLTK